MGDLMNRCPDVGGLAVVVDVLLLSVMGELRNKLPDVGVLYSLDSCGYLSATANCQVTVQEQLT
jgi:hypothetical protein